MNELEEYKEQWSEWMSKVSEVVDKCIRLDLTKLGVSLLLSDEEAMKEIEQKGIEIETEVVPEHIYLKYKEKGELQVITKISYYDKKIPQPYMVAIWNSLNSKFLRR